MTNCDSPYEHVRRRSEAIIDQEIKLATHLSANHILLDLPQTDKIDNFAAVINRYLQNLTLQQKFIIRIKVPGEEQQAERMYEKWLELKHLCEHSTYLSVMLEL